MASVLLQHENLGEDKHVESILVPRLDEGSIPSSSTGALFWCAFFVCDTVFG